MTLTQVPAHAPSARKVRNDCTTHPISTLLRRLRPGFLGLCLALTGGLFGTSALAQANLQISSFTYSTPVLNGSSNSFTVVAKNIGDVAAISARLRVFLPANFTFTSAPAGCAFENSPHSFNVTNNPDPDLVYTAPAYTYSSLRMLYCDYASVAPSPAGDISLSFGGVASASTPPQVANMAADFYSATVEGAGGVGADNYLEKTVTVNSGADLALQASPIVVTQGATQLIPPSGASTSSGSALTVTVKTMNNGPDPASTAQVQVSLPTGSNFGSVVVPSGSPWACSNASNTVTCNYGGSAVAAASNFADIVITGTLASNLSGSVSFGASIPTGAAQNATDPVSANNGPTTVNLTVFPVADLAATKSLLAYGVATTPAAVGKPATYRIGITNNGPNGVNTNLATLTDTIGAGWVIGAMPTGCSLSSRTVTCHNTALLGSGASVAFDIPVTAPGSGSCLNNTVTASLDATMIDTTAGNNTSATVSCTWVPATADLAASKRLLVGGSDVTQVALGQAAVFRIGISNGAGQPVVPTGGAQVVDVFDAAWTLGSMPAGCGKVGQVVTCSNASPLAAGQSVTYDIPVTAPLSGAGATNTATVSLLAGSGLTDSNSANDTASVTYSFGIPQVDVSATKQFRFNNGAAPSNAVGFLQPAVFRIGIANSASSPVAVPIGGANVVDNVPTGWVIGSLPGGCSATGQQVTCVNQSNISPGSSVSFDIPVTAPGSPDSCTGGFNTATVTLTAAGMVDPNTGAADSTSVACAAVTPNADIYVSSKSKVRTLGSGTLLGNGEQITSTITVKNRNGSNAFATGTITVTDTLGANEVFVSGGGAGGVGVWNACSAAGSVVTCTIAAPANGYAPNSTLPVLTITTQASLGSGNYTLTNTACAGLAADPGYALDTVSGDCANASINASAVRATVTLLKTATTTNGDATLNSAEDAITYTVSATATGFSNGTTVPTLVITDQLPASLYGTFGSLGPATTGLAAVVVSPAGGESCNVSGDTVTCTLKNLVDNSARAITITVTRPVKSGVGILNTATATSPDSFITPLSGQASVNVETRTDISVTKSANPTTSKTGTAVSFTAQINIDGPDGAANLKLLDAFDSTRFDYVTGSATVTPNPNAGSCAVQLMNEATGDAVFDNVVGLQCNLGTINPDTIGTRKTVTVQYLAMPKYPYPDAFNATYTNKVRVKTDTYENNLANNTAQINVTVQPPALDLSVTKTDLLDPVEWDDSLAPNAQINYLIKAISSNSSTSTAHNVKLIDVPSPPAGFTMTYASSSLNGGGSYSPAGGVNCSATNVAGSTSYVICSFADLPVGKEVWLNMSFDLGKTGGSPPRALSFNNVAKICADEGGPTAAIQATDPAGSLCGFAAVTNYDATPTDNRISERTTILPLTDLHAFYKKPVGYGTVTEITSIQLNEEFDYLVKLRNKGPVDSFLATVTDALPAGFRRTAHAITVTPGSAVGATNGNSCASVIASNVETVTCSIGPLPADTNADGAEDATKAWVIRIPVKADPVAFVAAAEPYNVNIPNTVSIVPAQDPADPTRPLSKDRVPGNNTATGNILVPVKAKLSGRVYAGLSLADAPTGSEAGIGSVTLTLTGLDDSGGACVTPGVSVNLACGVAQTVTTTAVTGAYLFDNLPPGRYTLEETQPASHLDGRIFLGTRSLGTGPAGTASVGFVAAGAKNSVSNIQLVNNEVAIDYNFEEYLPLTISGLVFEDRDRSGANGGVPQASASDPRIAGVKVRISGTDYANNVLGGVTGYLEQITSGTGTTNYSFASLPPPNGGGYSLTEVQPAAYVNGPIDPPTVGASAPTIANLSGAAAIGAAGSYARPDLSGNSSYTGIKITVNQVGTNYNFPEVRKPSLSGTVYVDVNINNVYNNGTDTKVQGATVVLRDAADLANSVATTTTDANGAYSFASLNPLLTYVLEEPLPASPAGLANRTTAVNVGTVNSVATGTAAADTPTVGTDRITGIDLSAGLDGINYNFGEDRTTSVSGAVFNDRNRDGLFNGSDTGISGVTLKLVLGTDCTVAAFATPGLTNPVSSALTTGAYSFSPVPSGYAYTVCETQPAGYADSSGSAVTTSIATGVLPFAGLTSRNFPEMLGSISGLVFNDSGSVTPANTNNGTQQAGEAGIGSATPGAGVLVTLTGTPSAGPALAAGGVLAYTDATGAYRFDDLFPGSYTLTESQPSAYVNGTATPTPVLSGSPPAADLGTYSRGALAGNSSYGGINLGIAQVGTTFNFPEVRRPSLSGTVYIDLNTNDSFNGSPTDTPISGATVILRDAALTQLSTTTTDGAGAYSFTLLDPFTTYVLEEPLPASPAGLGNRATAVNVGSAGGTAVPNTPSPGTDRVTGINLAQGLDGSGYNFGEDRTAAISGFVFNDRNRDGAFAGADTGVSGVTLTLVAGAICPGTTFVSAGLTNPVTSALTTGAYSFSPVPVGVQYTVCETQPTGYANGPSGAATSITIASLAAGGISGQNFPEVLGDIGGTVFADFGTGVVANNNNGTQEGGEPGVGSATANAGVPVTLTGTPSAGPALPFGGVTAYTDASGNYSFSDLYAGNYTVTQGAVPVALGTYANGINTAGAVSAGGTSGTAGGVGVNSVSNLLLNAGSQSLGNNFAKVPVAAIAGTVYIDLNANNVIDAEPTDGRISGVTLRLYQGAACSGAVLASTTSGVSGAYIFNGLNPGLSYTVCEVQPPAYGDAATNPGAGNTSPAGNAITVASLPLAGTSNNNFGESLGSIKGSVYQDFGGPVAANDRNGVRDAGEAGIVNVPVTLTGVDALGAAVNLMQTTDASGNFSFDRLLAPDSAGYTLAEGAIPAASGTYGDGRETAGNASIAAGDATSVNDRISGIRIAGGENATGYNFGEINVSTVSGLVYVDRDRNHALDAGDTARIAGVTLKLVQGASCEAGSVLQSTTSAADGTYSFSRVVIGANYLLCETQPQGYGNGNAKGVAGSNAITLTNLAASGSADNHFGEWLGSVAGYVFQDSNGNGVRDATEPGIVGVGVTLSGIDSSGAVLKRSLVTDATGHYQFDDLLSAGATGYTVTEQLAQPNAPGTQIPTYNGVTAVGTIAGVSSGSATAVSVLPSAVSAIALPAGGQSVDNNFGEVLLLAPDLVVTKSAGKTVFTEGNLAVYTLQVKNQGQAPTVGRYTVVDRLSAASLPAKWSMESATGSGWTCTIAADKLQISCDSTQVLAAGQTSPSAIQLNVAVAQGAAAQGALRNSVSVSGGGEFPDKAPQADELASPKPCAASPEFNACQTTTGVQISAGLDGHVWIDGGNKKVLDGSDKLLPGWIVEVYDVGAPAAAGKSFTELVRGGLPTRTTTTDAQGHYQLCGLEPGSQYRVLFRDPANRIAFPGAVTNEAGRVTGTDYWSQVSSVEGFQVLQLTLPTAPAGASSSACNVTATEQSLPLDPNGVVYDSQTHAPLPGAAVSLVPDGACPGYDPKLHVINYETYGKDGAGNPVMITGSDGFYKFLLSGDPTSPKSCQFRLVVQQPTGYNPAPSTVIPPKPALATPAAPGVYNVQPQKAAPTGTQDTSYHLALSLGLNHQEVFNNHIPLDPTVPGTLVLSKTGDKRVVELGDTVLYTVVVRQTAGDPTPQVSVRDRLPAGFTLVAGTVRLNNLAAPNPQGGLGPVLAFKLGALKTGQDISLSYRVRVGVGAQQGDAINRAQAWGCRVPEGCMAPSTLLPIAAAVASNEARYQVQVTGGVFTTTACVLGKIFVDCNNNHLQDPEELGIPGVRLYLETGASLISDSEGKYSQCGLAPRSHVLKVDATTLPRGSRLTTSSNRNLGDAGSLFIDAKNGELERADFIEGSCSNTVLEQVKARRAQGEVRSNETERAGEPALRFESKPPTAPQQATDSANQALVQPRWPAPATNPGAEHAR